MIIIKLAMLLTFVVFCDGFGLQNIPMKISCCKSIDTCFQGYWSQKNPQPRCPIGAARPNYYLYTRSSRVKSFVFTLQNIPLEIFEESKKIYLIAHGWTNNVQLAWIQKMKNELLKKDDAYVILIDWSYLATQMNYAQSASDTESVGAHVAKVLKKIRASKKEKLYTWCIGFSLGAHLCGQVGRRTHLNRITALDPAGPLFRQRGLALSKNDTDFLDVIHTDYMAGYHYPIGHVDFYPNKGHTQPTCLFFNSVCSHMKACNYFTASINNKCFEATKCKKLDNWKSCEDSEQQMGYHASPAHEGIFYLETSKRNPFCSRKHRKVKIKKNIIDYLKKLQKKLQPIFAKHARQATGF